MVTHDKTHIKNTNQQSTEIGLPVEQEQTDFEWNETESSYPKHQCIHTLFENQVTITPDTIAVVYEQENITYKELNQQSNQLAHQLLFKGIKTENRVGILLERSLDMIVSILAVLKTGACYILVDPTYPQQRIKHLITDSDLAVLITATTKPSFLNDNFKPIIFNFHDDREKLNEHSIKNPTVKTHSLSLASVNYTSGSTGEPKGVGITHQSVNRLVLNNTHLPIHKHCCVLHVSSITFDVSLLEIWGPLLNSGRCVLYPKRSPTLNQLETIINEENIDTLFLTTALFNLVIDEKPNTVKNIKYLITGGETLSIKHVIQAVALLPNIQIFNAYGPTENTSISTCYKIDPSIISTMDRIPIGKPISNSSAYVLDNDFKPINNGEIGELYVGGDGLARGYLSKPSLTAEQFIPNPFSQRIGDRLYRTGDHVQRLKNNQLNFIGRSDNQLKIRGHRVELGEIEQVLNQQNGVHTAVVLANTDPLNDTSIIITAYIVHVKKNDTNSNLFLTKEILFERIKNFLPSFMLPDLFIFLKELPLTSNGKIDRKLLSFAFIKQYEKNKKHRFYKKTMENNVQTASQPPAIFSQITNSDKREEKRTFSVSVSLSQKLLQFSQKQGVELFIPLLCGFNIFLTHYCEKNNYISKLSSTQHSETRNSRTIVYSDDALLKTKTERTTTAMSLLQQIKNIMVYTPGSDHIRYAKLQIPQQKSFLSALHQTLFIYQCSRQDQAQNDAKKTLISLDIFGLVLSIKIANNQIHGMFTYNSQLFDQNTIDLFTYYYQSILESIVNNPNQRINNLSILNDKRKQTIISLWNNTTEYYDSEQPVHKQIESQSIRTPNAIAVLFNDKHLTYKELNKRSNQLAHYIIRRNITIEDRIGLILPRSLEMVIAVLGIMKSGAAYVPIDHNDPPQRINYILKDSDINIVITHSSLLNKVSNFDWINTCTIDQDSYEISTLSHHTPEQNVELDNLAHIIYTSGSTGKPKGVLSTHRGLINRLLWMQDTFQINSSDRILQKTPFNFDVSLWEFFWPLSSGAQLVIAKPEGHKDPDYLIKCINEFKITVLHFVPSMLKAFLNIKNNNNLPSIKHVICSGEVLSPLIQNMFFAHFENSQLHNLYGPTEASIDVSFWQCKKDVMDKNIPIGKPIANTQLYILDDNLAPVAEGIAGELYIGGYSLARGYNQQAALTAENFIPSPFSTKRGSRLYKTGDIARYRLDGMIEYLGRRDRQVKIRGFRIELNEIECFLEKHTGISNAIVQANCYDDAVDPYLYLTAYIVLDNTQNIDQSYLRNILSQSLPDYAIPKFFVFLDKIPLTANGKIDYKSLPIALTELSSNTPDDYEPPKTVIEKTLCDIWQNVLEIKQIGIHDNFFSCGGDSILSLQIVSLARDAGIKISKSILFNNQTIESLAKKSSYTITPKSQQTSQGYMQHTPIQQWFLSLKNGNKNHFNQCYLSSVPQNFNLKFLNIFVEHLYQCHDVLRLRYKKVNNEWISFFVPFNTTMINNTIQTYQLPETHCEHEAFLKKQGEIIQKSLNIQNGPLLKAVFFEAKCNKKSRLLLVMHHLIVDGVSWRVLLQSLTKAYEQWITNKAIALNNQSSNFQQWSEKLYQYSTTSQLHSEIRFWLKQLNTATPSLSLDKFNSNEYESNYSNIDNLSFHLNTEDTSNLLTKCVTRYKTQINELLLSAIALAFQTWNQQTSLRIKLEGHGREELEETLDINQTIGWFTSIYPLSLLWDKNASLDHLIITIKEQLREIPQNGIGYGILHYCTKNHAILESHNKNPSEVMFNYLGQYEQNRTTNSLFSREFEYVGERINSQTSRDYKLRFTGEVYHNKLHFQIDYDKDQYHKKTIDELLQAFHSALLTIINHCLQTKNVNYSPSDFPLSQLTSADIKSLISRYPTLDDMYPATKTQLGLLYHNIKNDLKDQSNHYFSKTSDHNYCTQFQMTLSTNVDKNNLKKAWQKVISRHSSLRTAFIGIAQEQPQQLVTKEITISWHEEDWTEKTPNEFQNDFETYRIKKKLTSFFLDQPGLMNFSLFANNFNIQFLWSFHHSILDGWSIPIVLNELRLCYYNMYTTSPMPLPKVEHYRNYVKWNLSQDVEKAKLFWKKELQNTHLAHGIDLTKTEKINGTNEEKKQDLLLSNTITEQLTNYAKHYQVTLNTLIQAVWAYLIHSYSNSQHAIFGEIISGRTSEISGVEKIVGLLINTLPVQIFIDPNQNIGQWLKEIHDNQVKRERYSYLSLTDIHHCCNISYGNSLFNSLIAFQIDPKPISESGNLDNIISISDIKCFEQTHYDVTLVISSGKQLKFTIKYMSNTYSEATIKELIGNLSDILTALTLPNTTHISDLPLLVTQTNKNKKIEKNVDDKYLVQDKTLEITRPKSKIEKQVSMVLLEVLNLEENNICIHDNFLNLGIHSLIAIRIITRLYEIIPITLSVEDFYNNPTIFRLSKHLSTLNLAVQVFQKNGETDTSLDEIGTI